MLSTQAEPELTVSHSTLSMDSFAREVKTLHTALIQPGRGRGHQEYPQTLYSLATGLFARLDLLSAYWQGTAQDPAARITHFLNEYLSYTPEAHSVAVQMWQSAALTSGAPHGLHHSGTGRSYLWVLYWGDELPAELHFRFHDASHSRILSLGLLPLLEDVQLARTRYLSDLASSPALQTNYRTMEARQAAHRYQPLL